MDNQIRWETETDEDRRREKGREGERRGENRREQGEEKRRRRNFQGSGKRHMGDNPIHETDELELGGT